MKHIHTSGHASPVDLKRFAEALAPKALVPIHSFAPEKYEWLFSNVVYRDDGEWWEA
jgi:ribonuclease J